MSALRSIAAWLYENGDAVVVGLIVAFTLATFFASMRAVTQP